MGVTYRGQVYFYVFNNALVIKLRCDIFLNPAYYKHHKPRFRGYGMTVD
jgi:hypothetical protein